MKFILKNNVQQFAISRIYCIKNPIDLHFDCKGVLRPIQLEPKSLERTFWLSLNLQRDEVASYT